MLSPLLLTEKCALSRGLSFWETFYNQHELYRKERMLWEHSNTILDQITPLPRGQYAGSLSWSSFQIHKGESVYCKWLLVDSTV
jgi:hypothetical protein